MDERPVDEQVSAALAVLDGALASARIVGVYLFGSAVEDGLRPDSDIDLFVEMETPRTLPERATAIRTAFGLHPWPMDLIVYTPEEVARLRHRTGTFLATIESEGKVLYERPGDGLQSVGGEG